MASEFVRWICADLEGRTYEVTPADYEKCPLFSSTETSTTLLRQFVRNELGRRDSGASGGECQLPAHIRLMRRHELVDYCDASEKGHLRWYPKGLLIYQLLMDFARQLAHHWGALEMKHPVLIRSDANAVGELMGEFHERDYKVDGGRGMGYLATPRIPWLSPSCRRFATPSGRLR